MLPEFKIYYKVVVLKTVWYWGGGKRHTKINRLEQRAQK